MAIKASNQITITDVTDAYSVILTSEAYTFVGGTSGAASGATCSTQAVGYCGNSQIQSVGVAQADIVCPSGISASVTNNNTSAVTITFTLTATLSAAAEATIPVVVDGITINKKFSFAVAKTGSTGTAGSTWYSGTGITGTSTTATVFSGSGVASAKVNDQYRNTDTGNTYKCTVAGAPSAAKWVYTGTIKGNTGDPGADAISVSIIASNGTVFKNSSGSTVLSAHVYVAGVEKTVTANTGAVADNLGTIKWYKGSPEDTQPTGFPKSAGTLTVAATDVTNIQAYTCRLEG